MKHLWITTASILAISAWLTACSGTTERLPAPPVTAEETTEAEKKEEPVKKADFSTGTWDGHTFTSPWLNLSITFPEDSIIATEEEIQAAVGDGQELMINSGTFNKTQMKVAEFTTAYDFMVVLSDQMSNIQMAHENIFLSTLGKGISIEDYLDTVKGQVISIEDFEYVAGETETVTLAGQEFKKLPLTLMGGILHQDYYCISKGKYVSSLIVTYTPDSADMMDEILSGITTVPQ